MNRKEQQQKFLTEWLTSDPMRDYFRKAMARDLKNGENATIENLIEKGIIVREPPKA